MSTHKDVKELSARLKEIQYLQFLSGLASWDQEVYMRPGSAAYRSEVLSYAGAFTHQKFLALNNDKLLDRVEKLLGSKHVTHKEERLIEEVLHDYRQQKKLPEAFVGEFEGHASRSNSAWAEAREKSDYALYKPYLKKMIDLQRQKAEYIGYKDSKYDALLDYFETGSSVAMYDELFAEMKDFLVPLIKKIKKSPISLSHDPLKGSFSIDEQYKLAVELSERIGYDTQAGRIDVSTHPFTAGLHPLDTRFTVRYKEDFLEEVVTTVLHEAGHGMYEQGLDHVYSGTPLGESASTGVHESQSRMFELWVGGSKSFSDYLLKDLQKRFGMPFTKLTPDEFYAARNRVKPDFIRVEADEVTYNLHILIRYEMEKELIEGSLNIKDAEEAWNAKYKEYLGITVKKPAQGILQDVHWGVGYFGYFPTYTLGNLYAAQLFESIRDEYPKLDMSLKKGDTSDVLDWVRTHIHRHGRYYKSQDLIEKATKKQFSPKYFIDYIEKKYTELYDL